MTTTSVHGLGVGILAGALVASAGTVATAHQLAQATQAPKARSQPHGEHGTPKG